MGLKPIESGIEPISGLAGPGSDAHLLATSGSLAAPAPHPLYALAEPISPHLAARRTGTQIQLSAVRSWLEKAEAAVTPHVAPHTAIWRVVETAGGAFSPLTPAATNFDLATELDPAIWVLVASDSLGVLHDLTSTLLAMRARGRTPDHVVLSAAREPDTSTGSNAAELRLLGIANPTAVLERHQDAGIRDLVRSLLATPRAAF
jgi:dethiobiotin synthetase